MCLPVEEGVSKRVEFPEGFFRVDHQGVAGDDALVLAVHHRDEAVGGRFWTDPHPRKVLLQQVPEERERERWSEIFVSLSFHLNIVDLSHSFPR